MTCQIRMKSERQHKPAPRPHNKPLALIKMYNVAVALPKGEFLSDSVESLVIQICHLNVIATATGRSRSANYIRHVWHMKVEEWMKFERGVLNLT